MQKFNNSLERDFWMQAYMAGLAMERTHATSISKRHEEAIDLADKAVDDLRARNKQIPGVSVSIEKITTTSPDPDRIIHTMVHDHGEV